MTHDVRFTKPEGFDYAPVQFVGLEIETEDGSEEYPMSIACSPTKPYIEFGARVTDSAWKRAFVALEPGDGAEIDGPYGHFVLDTSRPAVLVAGGIGITPLKGMMEYVADKKLDLPVTLVYSNPTPEEIPFRDVVDGLARDHPNISVLHTITRPAPGMTWSGRTGRIDASLIAEAAKGKKEPAFYVCGPPGMVEAAITMIEGLGVSSRLIKEEAFYGYE